MWQGWFNFLTSYENTMNVGHEVELDVLKNSGVILFRNFLTFSHENDVRTLAPKNKREPTIYWRTGIPKLQKN